MKEDIVRVHKTACADTPEEFDRQCNEVLRAHPKAAVVNTDRLYREYEYDDDPVRIPETTGDLFQIHGVKPTCADCPFLEIGDDGRRKWFPCKYASYGETNRESPACEEFYKHAVALMRKAAER